MRGREYGGVLFVGFDSSTIAFPHRDGLPSDEWGTPLPLFVCKIQKTNDLFYDYLLNL